MNSITGRYFIPLSGRLTGGLSISRKEMNAVKTIEELMKELPPDLQQEVQDFARFLLETKVLPDSRKTGVKQKKLRMTWAGGLREFRDQFTSLELQKKALEWWGD